MVEDDPDAPQSDPGTCPECGATFEVGEDFCGECGTFLGWSSRPTPTAPPGSGGLSNDQEGVGAGTQEKQPPPPLHDGPPPASVSLPEAGAWVIDIGQSVSANLAWVFVGYAAKRGWSRVRNRFSRDRTEGTPSAEDAEAAALTRVALLQHGIRRRDLKVKSTLVPREGPALVQVIYQDPKPGRLRSMRFDVEVVQRGGRLEALITTTRHHY